MTTIQITSWKEGLKTVSLIETVRQLSTGSLVQAKARVDQLLDGETVTLQFATEALKEEFRQKAESLGAVCT